MSILNLIRSELLDSPCCINNTDAATHRLHANELPWSALTSDSIDLNFYPDNQLKIQLEKQLARRYQIDTDQITLTRGSDDGIDLLTRLFLKANQDALMQFPPTFSMYAFYVRLQQAQIIECPLDPLNGFTVSFDTIKNCWQEHCKIIMLCRPNNPTGNVIELQLIRDLCQEYKNRSVIVVDEAYMEFAEAQSATCLLPQFDNLIILRTLSKAHGLAGLRLGAVIAQAHVVQAFNQIIAPYTISNVVIELALKSLAHDNWFTNAMKKIKNARSNLINELKLNPLIEKIYPSETNFLLIKTIYSEEIASLLAKKNIMIRVFSPDSTLHHHLRITVGNEQQNRQLITALSSFQNYSSGS